MMKLPDSPKSPPWFQKIQYLTDPIGYLESNYQRYGDIFNAPIITNCKQQWLINHPLGVQELFARDGQEIERCRLEPLGLVVGDNSVLNLEGDAHQHQRKLLMPSFQQKSIISYGETISEVTEQVLSQLTPSQRFSASSIAQEIILRIILKIRLFLVFMTKNASIDSSKC